MRRCATILLAAAAATAVALPAVAGADSGGAVTLRVRTCEAGVTPKHRLATFYGRMRALPGTNRMAMRFTLLDRSSEHAAPLVVPRLAQWRRSRVGVRSFGYAQRVTDLRPGGIYAAAVELRWIDARGHTHKTVKRTS